MKKLLVEGEDDKAVVIHLMRHHVPWPNDKDLWPVYIEPAGSVDGILATGFITAKIKEPDLTALGVVLDADDKFAARWSSIRRICRPLFPDMPPDLPDTGLVIEGADGKRFGVWIMPDCASVGMLESFLRFLVPEESVQLWEHAQTAFATAREIGSPCREAHVDKALIHTWLAWQDPPGERLGLALAKKILNPHAPTAAPFVAWFKELYGF